MVDAAVGSRAILGRGIEKAPGIPQGTLRYLNFDSVDVGRNSKENPSDAITGFGGRDRASPGPIDHDGKLKYDLTTFRVLPDLVAMYGAPASVTELETGVAWLVKIRPGAAAPAYRGIWNYLHEGGSYSGVLQFGRRVSGITLADAANKRVKADVDYTEPTGDTIAGMPVAAVGNTGTGLLAQIASRGRRAIDADYTAGKSVYVKIVSSTAGSAIVVAKVDLPAFAGVGVYGADTFEVFRPDTAGHDGFSIVRDSTSNLLLGNFGENFEPFEITLGDQVMTLFLADDEFEFPVSLYPALSKVVLPEHRLSEFHLVRTVGGTNDIRLDSGSTKWMRPYKPYYSNGRKLPSNIDPTGDIEATVSFKKRLFDLYFRELQDAATRFTVEDVYKFGQPLVGTTFEGIHIFYPQMAVSTLKSGDIPNKNTLEETITLEAEQPDVTPTPPDPILDDDATFAADAQFPMQINVVTPLDPTYLL